MDIEVIMEAQFIPLGATVGVATGSRRYTLQSCIKVYNDKGAPLVIEGEGLLYLAAGASLKAIPKSKNIKWFTDSYTLRTHLEDLENEEYER